jgi:SAM-dependent methyltransferase
MRHTSQENETAAKRLNLGCGPDAPAGWLNVDGSWNAWLSNHRYFRRTLETLRLINSNQGAKWKVQPIVHDLTKRLPFEDNSISAVYASHVFEHLYQADAQRLLGECRRVLWPGGLIRLVVPDLYSMAKSYLTNKNGNAQSLSEKTTAADKFNEKLGFRSPAPPGGNLVIKFYYLWKDFHHHKWMYDSDSLIRYMRDAGFSGVVQKPYLDSEISGIEEVEEADRVVDGIGICVEGKKP